MVKAIRRISPILLVFCMILIFLLSAQEAKKSSQTSSELIRFLLNIIYPNFEALAESKQTELISSLQFLVRKSAHFMIYGMLGVFSFLSFVTYKNLTARLRMLLSLLVCLLYAVSDEIHQLFVVGRSCELRDVLIDFLGSLLAISFMYIVVRLSEFKGVLLYEKKRTV